MKDKLTLSDGTQVSIENIEVEKLETPETKYNFEVEDFHTYYVTDSDVLVHNDCFNKWLNKGDPDYTVYKGINRNGDEVYTGITKQELSKRLYQHNYAGKNFKDLKQIYKRLTRNQARSVETYLILTDGTSEVNKILSISRKSKYFQDAMEWAAKYIGGLL